MLTTARLRDERFALGTPTKVATIDEAPQAFAVRRQAVEIMAAFDGVPMDFTESERAWGYDGGRDLTRLEDSARASMLLHSDTK